MLKFRADTPESRRQLAARREEKAAASDDKELSSSKKGSLDSTNIGSLDSNNIYGKVLIVHLTLQHHLDVNRMGN